MSRWGHDDVWDVEGEGGEGRVAVERGGGRRRESIVGRREGDTDDMEQGAGVVREGWFA